MRRIPECKLRHIRSCWCFAWCRCVGAAAAPGRQAAGGGGDAAHHCEAAQGAHRRAAGAAAHHAPGELRPTACIPLLWAAVGVQGCQVTSEVLLTPWY